MIVFNKPYQTGRELEYIQAALASGKISGDGKYTKKCQDLLQERYGFKSVLLTVSCTAALEMAAILADIQAGDEVIIPSFTFVSTANAFVLRGAKPVFVDSGKENPNLDIAKVEQLITEKTKAIVSVHYGGVASDLDQLLALAEKHHLLLIEDAAQAIDSFYKGRPLGSIGHLAAFSFHETKNIISGEGGALVINKPELIKRAEIIREKGTNRAAFFRGEVDKYTWVDIGSSFLPSDIIAAFLYAQLENIDKIQGQRRKIWQTYYQQLASLGKAGYFQLPLIPEYATNNAHLFYLVCRTGAERDNLLAAFKKQAVMAIFHYQSLHSSPYYAERHDGRSLPQADRYSECLLRLPLYFDLQDEEISQIVQVIKDFYKA